jgi:ABC-type Zn uptake system ZnuABC Zn-binding protein ZnuA
VTARARRLCLIVLGAAVLGACGGAPTPQHDVAGEALNVVTTVSPITSLAENIAGTRAIVTGIVPEGANSHTFEPRPAVARTLANADLVFVNGLQLEEPTLRLAEANRTPATEVVALGDLVVSREQWVFDFSFPASGGRPNPHLWPDPVLAGAYARIIAERMAARDAANGPYYLDNLARLEARLERLDQATRAALSTVPPGNRRLLTYHDSWPYWARRYGFEVIGAVQPADFAEPSPREVTALIEQVRTAKVPAVFGSEVFPRAVLETIAREAGARFIDELRDDDLPGAPGDPGHSYLGLMRTNMEVLVTALGGSAEALRDLDVGPVFEGAPRVTYPQ